MSDVNIIFGGPGTGKTRTLLEIMDDLFKQGVEPNRIAYLAFTRKAAHEGRDRACQKFGFVEDDLPFFRTIHSFAFKMLELSVDEVIGDQHFKEIGQELGMTFGQIDVDTGLTLGTSRGDRYSHIEQSARVKLEPLGNLCVDQKEKYFDVKLYVDTLKSYKKANHLVDFTDMLELYLNTGPVPPLDVVIIDEAQDLSPLQWAVIRKVCKDVPTIYVAGDDDQAIYAWAGASVELFLGCNGDRRILEISHRLSMPVFRTCESILRWIAVRQQKVWKSAGHTGAVLRYAAPYYVDYSQGSWYLLARNKYMLVEYKEHLERKGYPYVLGGLSSVDNDDVRALIAWELLRKGEHITTDAARLVYQKLLPGCVAHGHKKLPLLDQDTVNMTYLVNHHGLRASADWMEVLRMPSKDREYYRSIRQRGESLYKPPRITISTIHGVKGGEADHVALMLDMATRSYDHFLRDPDDEARCFYVGASRAKSSLHLIHPNSPKYFPIGVTP